MGSVVIVHPDLGIGGAERLVVDVALSLKHKGYAVQFFTTHHDINHCFDETRNGDIPVTVIGDWIPRHFFHYFHALMAYLRMIYCALYLTFFSKLKFDVVICDLVSVAIPIYKLAGFKVVFYCHHPDMLLSRPGNVLKTLYRAPLNWLEEVTTAKADRILVNSKYTAAVFKRTFTKIKAEPDVLYPSLNTEFFDAHLERPISEILPNPLPTDAIIFLSINRYERKKNLQLAIDALKDLQSKILEKDWTRVHLIMAGGYDFRVQENIEHFTELVQHSTSLKLEDKITFLISPSDLDKLSLLKACACLIYTPSNEHFGIVPIEAMYMEKPVVAVNSGGPLESILDGRTGFLVEPNAHAFSSAMSLFIEDKQLGAKFGKEGRKQVIKKFSFQTFSNEINEVVSSLLNIGKEE